MRCACVLRCCVAIVPPRRCPLYRSAGAGYRLLRNLLQVPTPLFSGGACVSGVYCPRRVVVAVLVSCVLVAGHAVRVSAMCISLSMAIACGVCPIWLLRYVLPIAAVYTTLRPYIYRYSRCAL